MLGQRLNKSDYVDIMATRVRDGEYTVEAARLILEEAGVEVTRPIEMMLIMAETEYINELVSS